MKQVRGTAFIITEEFFHSVFAKTAHGLIRHTDRFDIKAVIDRQSAGQDAGLVLDQKRNGIPICESLNAAIEQNGGAPDYCIVGIATAGGILPQSLRETIKMAISQGISIVCGLHQFMNDVPELKEAAIQNNVELIDIRKPRPTSELSFWKGDILNLKTPRIAILGMDCAVGKRTTCGMLHAACRAKGIQSEMIYTGQTGWLQGYEHGFIFDSTTNDFISGEIEHAIMECEKDKNPALILVEGQSALRNPSGPCGSEFLLSGDIKNVILQHVPFRSCYEISEGLHYPMPTVESELKLIELYGARTLGISLNGEGGNPDQLLKYQINLEREVGIPVIRPFEEGVDRLMASIQELL